MMPSFRVKKTFYGKTVYMDFRDNIDEFSQSSRELENREQGLMEISLNVDGALWDVGANIGLFSVRAASAGCQCVAFEFSHRAAALLQQTVTENRLPVVVVQRAFSSVPKLYEPAKTAGTRNQVGFSDHGSESSVTYRDAEAQYGTPAMIKMDIEGGEKEFFDSSDFKAWIVGKEICWLVELHPEVLGYVPEWPDVPRVTVDLFHHLYCANQDKLVRLSAGFLPPEY
jgi:FkbM family methyltransferase